MGGGAAASTGFQFREPSFTFGGQESLMAVPFLVCSYGRRHFHFIMYTHIHIYLHKITPCVSTQLNILAVIEHD